MGTRFYALLPDLEEGRAERLFYHMKGEVRRIERKLSRFLPESDISRLNTTPAGETITLDQELWDLLEGCRFMWDKTNGAFDLTLRPLTEFWKEKNAEVGDLHSEAREKCGFEHLKLDVESGTLVFGREGMELDFGGLGKGYALEKVKEMVLNGGAESAFISFGESSILAVGEHPAGGAWKIGMNNYLEPGQTLHEFRVENGSVSTSSNFYLNDSGSLINHRHIIDPKSGTPFEKLSAVSVSAKSPLLAEMLSTACLIADDQLVEQLSREYGSIEVVRADYSKESAVLTEF